MIYPPKNFLGEPIFIVRIIIFRLRFGVRVRFVLFLFLMWMHTHKRFTGQVFAAYLVGYGVLRFVNEFFRGDRSRGILFDGAISVHQLIALTLVAISLVIIYFGKSKSSYGRA